MMKHKTAKLYTASLITTAHVIPAKAVRLRRTERKPGFRVKPGMTNCIRLMSSCIDKGARELGGEESKGVNC
jgi:hypothetical protein